MESRSVIPDRKLLARLVLIREEARNMMGGGILDERNDRGLNILPESEVCYLNIYIPCHILIRWACKSVKNKPSEWLLYSFCFDY